MPENHPENRQIHLTSRPTTQATTANFTLVTTPLAPLAENQVRVRNHYLSLDPYMRGRMNDSKSYAPPQPLNQVMQGGTVGEVTESRNPNWHKGDKVRAMFGWQDYGTTDGTALQRLDNTIPLSAHLGPAGMPGVTAWYGLNEICKPQPGETVVVSAASGAVGTVVGQLAKQAGAKAIGIAGGPEKCRYVKEHLGFDACLDHKSPTLAQDLHQAAPNGIDAYFDNVGGPILDAVMLHMNAFGRIAVCGAIAGYDGPPLPMARPNLILLSRLLVQGFIVSEHMDIWPKALKHLATLIATGQLKYRETIAQGLESAPEAFLGMLKGQNFGKQLVKLT